MVPPEYTDRILPGEPVYLAPNGRFHRAGCRYYVPPGPDAVFVEGTFTEAFLANYCKLCFPHGVPVTAHVTEEARPQVDLLRPAAEAVAGVVEAPAPAPIAVAPEGPPEPSLPVASAALAGLPPLPPVQEEHFGPATDDRPRKRRKKQKLGNRPPAVTKIQIAIFLVIVLTGVGVFVALATLLHWFG